MNLPAAEFIGNHRFIAFRLEDEISQDLHYIYQNYPKYGLEKFSSVSEVFYAALSLGINMLKEEIDSYMTIAEIVKERTNK